jgi:hypothetical protein
MVPTSVSSYARVGSCGDSRQQRQRQARRATGFRCGVWIQWMHPVGFPPSKQLCSSYHGNTAPHSCLDNG